MMIAAVFFSRTLERRYSYKITASGSALCWIALCLLKLPFFFSVGVSNMAVFNGIGLLFMFAYQIGLFRAAPVKRILSMVLFYVVMFFGEMLSTHTATLIFGENRFLQTESAYTVAAVFIMCLWATLALYPAACLWDLLMRVEKGRGEKRLWLCVLLPLSQWVLLEYFIETYESKFRNIPPWSFGGWRWGFCLISICSFCSIGRTCSITPNRNFSWNGKSTAGSRFTMRVCGKIRRKPQKSGMIFKIIF